MSYRRLASTTLVILGLVLPAGSAAAQAAEAALSRAIREGRAERVREIVQGGVAVETPLEEKLTPLLLAARHGRANVVRTLLDLGARIDARSDVTASEDSAYTALMFAAEAGFEDVVVVLLDRGADANAASAQGVNATMLAALEGKTDVLRRLLDRGADVNAVSGLLSWGDSAATALIYAAAGGSAPAVELLLERGARVGVPTRDGEAPLHVAAGEGHAAVVRSLLGAGAPVDAVTHTGTTPLMWAAEQGHRETVEVLLADGADVNARAKRTSTGIVGATALFFAAAGDHVDVMRVLVEGGADVNGRTQNGLTPLMSAAAAGHRGATRLLLDRGAIANAQTEDGVTALMHAAASGHADVVELLLDRGAGLNTRGTAGSALHRAAEGGHLEVVRLLLRRRGDPHARNDIGQTALMLAAGEGNAEIVRALLDAGADPGAADDDGDVALGFYAAASGHTEIVRLLLGAGVDPDTPNAAGETPIAFATRHGHTEVAQVLEEAGATRPAAVAGNEPDLTQMLPSAEDVGGGATVASEGWTPDGEYERDFQPTAMVFRLGDSQILMLSTAVDLSANAVTALAAVRAAGVIERDALLEVMLPAMVAQAGFEPDSAWFEEVEAPEVGEASAVWFLRMTTPIADFDVAILFFARGRVTGRIMGMGGRDQVRVADLAGVARVIDERVQRGLASAPPAVTPEPRPVSAEAQSRLAEGERLARRGRIPEAITAYEEAQAMDAGLTVTAMSWNTLCWYGSLWGHAAQVLDECERAVRLAPTSTAIRDSRGVARALTGDRAGAIQDFEAFVAAAGEGEERERRERWIAVLASGENPFSEEGLTDLRGAAASSEVAERATRAAGYDLAAMVPDANELGEGAIVTSDGFVERDGTVGAYRREFEAEQLVFPLGGSRVLGAVITVALYEDRASAAASLERPDTVDARSWVEELLGQEFPADSSVVLRLEPAAAPAVGDRATMRRLVLETPVFALEGYGATFVVGRVAAEAFVLGSQRGVAVEDMIALTGDIAARIAEQRSP